MRRRSLALSALVVILPIATTFTPEPAPALHPHCNKSVEVNPRGTDLTMKVSHLTVTFDKEGAEKMPVGNAWHLGGALLEVSEDVKIGGADVEAGKHSLKARKTDDGWELVIDGPKRFNSKVSDDAQALKTAYKGDAMLFEHLSIDIHPSGDKSNTKMYLDVHFDTKMARCEIELPKQKSGR